MNYGVQDYLNHAKGFMETFSDIVGWMKANSTKVVSTGELQSADSQVKITSENDESSQLARPGFPKVGTGIFGASWPSGSFGNSSTPVSFGGSHVSFSGNATSTLSNGAGSNEADEDDCVQEPSSPSLKRSQENGIATVYEVKCKLYVKSSDPADQDAWKDKGMGHLSIKCREELHSYNTSHGRDNNNTAVAHTFLIRTKNEEARDKLAAAIKERAPAT